MNSVNKTEDAKGHALLMGLVYAFALLLILSVVISFILWLSGFKEENLSILAYAVHAIALITGGYVAGRRRQEKGWFYGAILGIIYAFSIMIIGILAYDASFGWSISTMLLPSALLGAIGGIVGVNALKS